MNNFWRGKSVLVTGHTGFKGSWLSHWLLRLGASVHGLSLPAESQSLYRQSKLSNVLNSEALIDLRDRAQVQDYINQVKPSLVFHLAAQSLVRRAYREPVETFSVNIMGTACLLDALLREGSARAVVCVTSDKCYQNREWEHPYRESDRLGGHDPYSASKAAVELLIASYRSSFANATGVSLSSARAGNVIGGGDWAEDRLLPDCIRAFAAGDSVVLRNPDAIRPWQHVLDPLSGYLRLAQAQYQQGKNYESAWNFGPDPNGDWTVRQLVERIATQWPGASWMISDDAQNQPHEHQLLRLDISRARHRLNWSPGLSRQEALEWTLDWYKQWFIEGESFNAAEKCIQQIDEYMRRVNHG